VAAGVPSAFAGPTRGRDCDVMLMVALPASRSMPIGAPAPCDGLTTSIFCRSRSSRTQLRASEIARRRMEEERAGAFFLCE
jgi:hypothetical protein